MSQRLICITSLVLPLITGIDGVLNGIKACPGQIPYVAAIWQNRRVICTGGILNDRHILTAGHCLNGPKENYGVVVGKTDMRNVLVHRLKVEEFYVHPDYVHFTDLEHPRRIAANDIGIMKLKDRLEWNQYVKPIPLKREPGRYDTPAKVVCQCLVAGWGSAQMEQPRTSLSLEWTKLVILNVAICRKILKSMTDTEICALDPRRRSSASPGDSGAPVVCGGFIIGVLLSGPMRIGPNRILRTYYYIDFIEAVLSHVPVMNDTLPAAEPNAFEFMNQEGVFCT